MDLIKMKELGDCGPACLAMLTGRELDDVISWVKELSSDRSEAYKTNALSDCEMLDYLWSHGYPDARVVVSDPRPPCILTVPSLNVPGLLHYIVWASEGVVLDPALGPKFWPQDAPVVNGERVNVQWASAIVPGEKE